MSPLTIPRRVLALAAAAASFAVLTPVAASDHIDSPASGMTDLAADLTDLFAFTSPTDQGHLVAIMNVHPQASAASRFSDKATYSFRLRPDSRDDARELRVDCAFDAAEKQSVTCTAYAFDTKTRVVSAKVASGAVRTGEVLAERDGMRVYAGLRADPFFLDVGLGPTFKKGTWSFVGKNSVHGFDALSIVVELDVAKLLPKSSLLRVAAEVTKKKVSR